MDSSPFFSICIPTRNRPDTLFHCLKSTLHQNFLNYEIIVSDNSDNEETKKVVESLKSPLIKYYKQTTILSMADNFEFALNQANGTYIIFIGDDDGIVMNSLINLFDFIVSNNYPDAVKCPLVQYFWKGNLTTQYSTLLYPKSQPIRKVSAKDVLIKVANCTLQYFNLPMIYNGAVHKNLVNKIKEKQGSFFANAAAVDIYSGISISYNIDWFYITDFPFTVAGQSAKSNGSNIIGSSKKQSKKISSEFIKLGNLNTEYKNYKVPQLHQFVEAITWLCLEQFKNNYKLTNDSYSINVSNFYKSMNGYFDLHPKKKNAIIDDAFIDVGYTKDWLQKQKLVSNQPNYFPSSIGLNVSFIQNHIKIECQLFNIENVFDACKFSHQIGVLLNNGEAYELMSNNFNKYKRSQYLKEFKYWLKCTKEFLLGN